MMRQKSRPSMVLVCLLWAVISGGILFRLAFLGHSDLWYDEGLQFWVGQGVDVFENSAKEGTLAGVLKFNAGQNLDPPLLSVLVHFWSKAYRSIPWLRLLPCLFGVLAIFLTYFIARILRFSEIFALSVAAFHSWSAASIHYSLDLKPYSLVMLFSFLVLLYSLKITASKNIRTRDYLGMGLIASLGCASHYGFWLLLPALFGEMIIFSIYYSRKSLSGKVRDCLIFCIPVLAVTILLFVGLLQPFQMERWAASYRYMPRNMMYHLSSCLSTGPMVFLKNGFIWSGQIVSWQLFCLGRDSLLFKIFSPVCMFLPPLSLIFLIDSIRKKEYLAAVPLAFFLYSLGVSAAFSTFGSYAFGPTRYSLFFFVFSLMAFFIVVSKIAEFLRFKGKQGGAGIFLLLFLPVLIYSSVSNVEDHHKQDDLVAALAKVDDRVVGSRPTGVYVYFGAVPVFQYHRSYSDLDLFKKVDAKNVYLGKRFQAFGPDGLDAHAAVDAVYKEWNGFFKDFSLKNTCSPQTKVDFWFIFQMIPKSFYDGVKLRLSDSGFIFAEEFVIKNYKVFKIEKDCQDIE